MKSLFILLLCQSLLAGEPYLREIAFAHTQDVGFGNEVCVVGNHPHLGDNDPLRAAKLTFSAGNVWKANIALPAGEAFSYRFLQKSNQVDDWCNPASYLDLTPTQTLTVPAGPSAPWAGKTIFYRKEWAEVDLLVHDLDDGIPDNWQVVPMRPVGGNEHRIELPIPPGHRIEFVFKDRNTEDYDNAPAPPNDNADGTAAPNIPVPFQSLAPPYNYRTDLDVLFVQNEQVFTRRPLAEESQPRIEVAAITSTVASIPSRNIRVYLPRGYDQGSRRYPLILMHDGQNCYFPGGTFGTWDADRIASYQISQGRMAEAIICAVDNSNNRLSEYLPDGDSISGSSGNAIAYGEFLTVDVLPHLLQNYRLHLTEDEAAIAPWHFAMAGSSLGGLVSGYLGQEILLENDEPLVGALGIFSASYWAAPNHVARRDALARLNQRTFFYMGTAESSGGPAASQSFWADTLQAYDHFNSLAHSHGRELAFTWGCGAGHNEPSWSQQLPAFFSFAFSAASAANHLAAELFPPVPCLAGESVEFIALRGIPYLFRESENLMNWNEGKAIQTWEQPWQQHSEAVSASETRRFFRVDSVFH